MLNNHQRHYVSRHGLYPHFPLAPPGRFDFSHDDTGLDVYRQDASQQSVYARDNFTAHLAPQSLPTQQLQQQQRYSSALASSYAALPFPQLEHSLSHRSRHIQQPGYRAVADASSTTAALMDDEQLAHMQQLSATFEPEVKGPLASELQPTNIIVEEYANADPIYQRKTISIASTYSNIRTIRGDGQCGWRAVAFGYFERLVSARDPNLLLQEEARLRSLVNIVKSAGIAPEIYDDFTFETFTLMRDLSTAMRNGTAEGILLERFNDEHVQNYIITQFKSLTTAWLKTHFDEYSDFIVKANLDNYCEQQIMPVKSEIDQISLMALKDVLLAPAGIGLEVEYLDLSPGQDGTLHRFTRPGQSIHLGVQRLLYRPGHYDILYKAEDLPGSTFAAFFQLPACAQNDHITPLARPDFMHLIPGMSTVLPTQSGWQATPQFDMSDLFDAPLAQPCAAPSMPLAKAPSRPPMRAVQQSCYIAPQPTPLAQQEVFTDNYLLDPTSLRNVSTQLLDVGTPFRLTGWHHKQESEPSQTQLQTAQFKNSHYNTAHFNNPDFQPETWSPDKEEKKALDEAFGHIARSGRYKRTK